MNKTRVLFLCTGNSARSQMAEALLRKYADEHFEVHSAGLQPKDVHPYTIKALDEIGVDTSQHTSKSLINYIDRVHFGYVITVCSDAEKKCPIFPGMGMRLHWPFEDPAAFVGIEEATIQKFRAIRDQIDTKVCSWLVEQGLLDGE